MLVTLKINAFSFQYFAAQRNMFIDVSHLIQKESKFYRVNIQNRVDFFCICMGIYKNEIMHEDLYYLLMYGL